LLDAELTSQVYLELLGGRQKKFSLSPIDRAAEDLGEGRTVRTRPVPLAALLTRAEADAHALFVANELGKNALWIGILGVS
jgi:DNA polymerase-3 subunit epsilon